MKQLGMKWESKNKWKLGVCMILALVMLTACGEKFLRVSTDTLYIKKNGEVEEASFEMFDKEYYNVEELQKFAEEEARNYNYSIVKEAVAVNRVEVLDNVAAAYLTYVSLDDYIAFNEMDMFAGTVKKAMDAEYDFNTSFVTFDKGEEVNIVDVTEAGDNKILILDASIDVRIDGKICYISNNVQKKDKKNVTLTQGSLSYIIYK